MATVGKIVSIIIPIYNAESSLEMCLSSVCRQTHKDIEIILVDDGSIDLSREIYSRYAKDDVRVKTIRQKNQGAAHARNRGIKIARGHFVAFVDSDDYIEPDMIEKMLSFAENAPNQLTICGMFVNGSVVNPLPPPRRQALHSRHKSYIAKMLTRHTSGLMHALCCKLFSLEVIKKHKLLIDESIPESYGEDLDFVMKYLKHVDGVVPVYSPLYHYVLTSNGLASSASSASFRVRKKLFQSVNSYFGDEQKIRLLILKAKWSISVVKHKIQRSISFHGHEQE